MKVLKEVKNALFKKGANTHFLKVEKGAGRPFCFYGISGGSGEYF